MFRSKERRDRCPPTDNDVETLSRQWMVWTGNFYKANGHQGVHQVHQGGVERRRIGGTKIGLSRSMLMSPEPKPTHSTSSVYSADLCGSTS